ncbi:hypothetical protein GDO86_008603 [Hymenochirus boettgeri]|uniref:Uncharacterized protein n=1 Tax=Hymenochirus boettgeri TaxID=247094 RepID=A0A8T2J2S7_9PIPI|nr:hypothetical protein GDO86_008603 [Hymenochirus boettgeri]
MQQCTPINWRETLTALIMVFSALRVVNVALIITSVCIFSLNLVSFCGCFYIYHCLFVIETALPIATCIYYYRIMCICNIPYCL